MPKPEFHYVQIIESIILTVLFDELVIKVRYRLEPDNLESMYIVYHNRVLPNAAFTPNAKQTFCQGDFNTKSRMPIRIVEMFPLKQKLNTMLCCKSLCVDTAEIPQQ